MIKRNLVLSSITFVIFSQLFNLIICNSQHKSILKEDSFKNLESILSRLSTKGCLIRGCNCFQQSIDTVVVDCDGKLLNYLEVPFLSVENPKNLKISTLTIMNFHFSEIPSNAFNNVTIKEISFVENILDKVHHDAFANIVSLSHLEFIQNTFLNYDPSLLEPLSSNLRRITFSGNQLTYDDLNFTNNSNNPIYESVKRLNTSVITNICLQNQKLVNFDEDWLKEFKNLTVLNLSKNNLTSLNSSVFFHARQVEELNLNSNKLGPVFNMHSLRNIHGTIRVLSLKSNCINHVSIDSRVTYHMLTKLDLSNNELTVLYKGSFKNMPMLEVLRLENNKIFSINRYVFKSFKKLKILSLENNQLKSFEANVFSSLFKLEKLNLAKNILTEIPDIRNLTELLVLDVSDQNVRGLIIQDYAFDRENADSRLSVSLVQSNSTGFIIGKKPFCSKRNQMSPIDVIEVTASSFLRNEQCFLAQIEFGLLEVYSKNGNDFLPDERKSSVCNCHMANYLAEHKVRFGSTCNLTESECEQQFWYDWDMKEYGVHCFQVKKYKC